MKKPRDKIYLQAVVASLQRLLGNNDKLNRLAETLGLGNDARLQEAMALSMGFLAPRADGYGNPSSLPMTSILEEVRRAPGQPTTYVVKPGKLTLDAHLMPQESAGDDLRHDLGELTAELEHLPVCDNAEVTAENLLDLFFTHASTIPCSPLMRDVSLYDQTRMMAALNVLLNDVDHQTALDSRQPFLLIGGDFSGIQNYIYEIVSKHAGKNLKGRSFYVKLLGDAVVRYLLRKLDLYRSNVVYNSGGGFFLLAANTEQTLAALQQAVAEIEERLFATHDTAIYVAIDSIAITREEVAGADGSQLKLKWKQLFEKRDAIKQHRYADMLGSDYNRFFEPVAVNNDLRDAITGLDLGTEDCCTFKGIDGQLSRINRDQILLGQALRQSKCIAAVDGTFDLWHDRPHIEPAGLGITYYLLPDEVTAHEADALGASVQVKVLNAPVGLYGSNVCTREFYGGNHYQQALTFEQMCDSKGDFERLGVLRMDVDNLGSIFQKGLDPTITSLTRYAALSRSLDVFFSGYLNTLCKGNDQLFILYSGGDDLFVVGDWQEVIALAENVSTKFDDYTCHNPAFHISGGVALVKAKFPIIAGAQLSAEQENNAKEHKCVDEEKNAIAVLNHALHWRNEFPVVKSLKRRIMTLLSDQKLNKSFLSKVMLHAANAHISNHRIEQVKTYWMLSYDLSRYRERSGQSGVNELIDQCKREVCTPCGKLGGETITTDYHPLELWALACRWAELEYRSK